MLKIKRLFLLLTFAFVLSGTSVAIAEQDSPLVIIRFNQDFVKYEKSLHKSVSAALKVKPATFFDVVSLVPHSDSSRKDKASRKTTESLTDKVVANIKNSGVSDDKIRVTYKDNPSVSSPEVHVFVR